MHVRIDPKGYSPQFFPFLFLSIFSIYLWSLNPSLFRNDSPETITACWTLGISHAPGYPLHTLLGRLFSLLPLGNPAFTLNLFSAVLASLAVCLFAANLRMFLTEAPGKKKVLNPTYLEGAIFAASLTFGLSSSFWSAALAAKGGIYTLQVLLGLLLLYFAQSLVRQNRITDNPIPQKWFFSLIFIFSLGLSNHWPTQLLLVPACLFLVLTVPKLSSLLRAVSQTKFFIRSLSFFSIGFSLYLYLPLRSNLHPNLDFGAPCVFKRFLSAVLREHYTKSETLLLDPQSLLPFLQRKFAHLSDHLLFETHILGSCFAILGGIWLFKIGRSGSLLGFLSLTATALGVNWVYLKVDPIDYWHISDHLLTVNWTTGLLSSLGLIAVINWARGGSSREKLRPIPLILIFPLIFSLPFLTFSQNRTVNEQSRNFLFHGYGSTVLRSIEKGGFYFAEQDYDFFSTLYFKEVLFRRPDIGYVNSNLLTFQHERSLLTLRFPEFFPKSAPAEELSKSLSALMGSLKAAGIYCAFPDGPWINHMLNEGGRISFRPQGIVTRLDPKSRPQSPSIQMGLLEDFWGRYLLPEISDPNPIEKLLLQLCCFPFLNSAEYFRFQGDPENWDLLHERALALANDWHTTAIVWDRKARGNEMEGKTITAINDYRKAAHFFKLNQQNRESQEAITKAVILTKRISPPQTHSLK